MGPGEDKWVIRQDLVVVIQGQISKEIRNCENPVPLIEVPAEVVDNSSDFPIAGSMHRSAQQSVGHVQSGISIGSNVFDVAHILEEALAIDTFSSGNGMLSHDFVGASPSPQQIELSRVTP
jgi:hypothetical protein